MNFLQRIKDGASRVSEKAQSSVEVGKLSSQISDIEHEMDMHFLKMGKLFYEGYRSRDLTLAEGQMVELSRSCLKLQEEIDELRFKIAELKNERLCKCGHVASLDANFCPKCGRKLEEAAPKKEAAAYSAQPVFEPEEEDEFYGAEELTEEERELALRMDPRAAVYTEVQPAEKELPPESYREDSQEPPRSRREADELERERERQLELDRRIRDWRAGEPEEEAPAIQGESLRDTVKCQICRNDLPKGSMWCPRCGSEQI
ncbi:zinc ribbon domain-containing protein ['Paenibacillus yunnanensis' Narsing Rao et al. 2020]|uniref:zinc ribbon domain-containing protein n=1 Tax=Paenibacillus tengchongensis TaxID=2608684 RepID=UPI00124C5B1F|nr:zinc ribbon domain-containing protein [Paenibacillus tengchongensis]